MVNFKNILIVVNDKSPSPQNPAIKRGRELAISDSAKITLMDIVTSPETEIAEYKGIFKPEELTEMLVNKRKKILQKIASTLSEDKIDVDVLVTVGRDFIETVRQMIMGEHDLLIKVANDHPDSFDSSDFHLMRKCPKPVWLMKPQSQPNTNKILAAVDLNLESHEEGSALNTQIMEMAASLARNSSSQLHVLSCWSLYGESTLRNSVFVKVSDEKLAALLEEVENSIGERQVKLVSKYSDIEVQRHLTKGDPVELIPQFVRDHNIDITVMGTVARSGVPGLLIGNTAETILHLIDTSVITLKPRGFESPVK